MRAWAFTPREMGALDGCAHWKEVTDVYTHYSFIALFPSRHIQRAPTLCSSVPGLVWAMLGTREISA